MKIAVLIPCLNEEISIATVINDFKLHVPDAAIYVYDNASTDATFSIAKENGAFVETHKKKGKTNTVLRMFADIEADLYVLVDGDDTYPAKSCNNMINLLLQNQADMVVGDRLSNLSYKKENKRNFHNFGNKLMKSLINYTFNENLNDILSGYRVFSKKFVKTYISLNDGFELETDLTIFALHHKLSIAEYPIEYKDRPLGSESKLNTFSDGSKVIFAFFRLLKNYKPFYFFSRVSFLTLLLSISFGVLPVYEFMKYNYVYKVPSFILSSILLLLCCLFLIAGFILQSISNTEKKKTLHQLLHFKR